jgi:hypothetical protein
MRRAWLAARGKSRACSPSHSSMCTSSNWRDSKGRSNTSLLRTRLSLVSGLKESSFGKPGAITAMASTGTHKRGDARIPSWQEAGDFMNAFESFAEYKVTIQRICLLRRKEGNDGTDFHYRANGTRNATKFNKNAFMSISCRLVEIMGRQDRLCRK